VHRPDIDPKQQADSEHAFGADHSHFQTGVAIHRGDQGDEAVRRKVNMPDAIAGQAQNVGEGQLDSFAVLEQMFADLVWQGGDQTVRRGIVFGKLHRDSPVVVECPTGGEEDSGAHPDPGC